MRSARTQEIGNRTSEKVAQASQLAIQGKDPACDYSFRLRREIEEGGGMDHYGWEPVGVSNSHGETWALPFPVKTKGSRQIVYHDTVLCKRKKEITKWFKSEEDKKYNQQQTLIKEAAPSARQSLRKLDPNAQVVDEVKSSDGFKLRSSGKLKQRSGPTEQEEN
jgi:hypothetical protein